MDPEDSFLGDFCVSHVSIFFCQRFSESPICRFLLLGGIFQASFVKLTELRQNRRRSILVGFR